MLVVKIAIVLAAVLAFANARMPQVMTHLQAGHEHFDGEGTGGLFYRNYIKLYKSYRKTNLMGRSYGHVLAAFGSQSPQIQYLRALNMPLVFCWLHFICSCRRVDLLVYARHWCRLCLADEHWLCGLRRLSHCQLHSRVRCVRSSAHLRCLNRCLVRCAMCFKRSALV